MKSILNKYINWKLNLENKILVQVIQKRYENGEIYFDGELNLANHKDYIGILHSMVSIDDIIYKLLPLSNKDLSQKYPIIHEKEDGEVERVADLFTAMSNNKDLHHLIYELKKTYVDDVHREIDDMFKVLQNGIIAIVPIIISFILQ